MSADRFRATRWLAGVIAMVAAGVPCAAAVARSVRRAPAGPRVEVMVVGPTSTLLRDRTVAAAPARIRVGGRRCVVAAATPLAALAAARHAGGPAFALRDYGHCGRSTRDAGGLFVTAIGGERNRGADGWVYKVGHVAGTQGAGDALGPLGDGRRIAAGQRVLWFWCTHARGQSGCQRTLELSGVPSAAAPQTPVTITVSAYDDGGRAVPAAGATVSLGTTTATTGADGRATVVAPSTAGAYSVTAAQAGLVPSFPVAVTVR